MWFVLGKGTSLKPELLLIPSHGAAHVGRCKTAQQRLVVSSLYPLLSFSPPYTSELLCLRMGRAEISVCSLTATAAALSPRIARLVSALFLPTSASLSQAPSFRSGSRFSRHRFPSFPVAWHGPLFLYETARNESEAS